MKPEIHLTCYWREQVTLLTYGKDVDNVSVIRKSCAKIMHGEARNIKKLTLLSIIYEREKKSLPELCSVFEGKCKV